MKFKWMKEYKMWGSYVTDNNICLALNSGELQQIVCNHKRGLGGLACGCCIAYKNGCVMKTDSVVGKRNVLALVTLHKVTRKYNYGWHF